jgi:hypothetical protein
MTFRGIAEQIRAANDAAYLDAGWTQGRRPDIRDDRIVCGHALNAAWETHRASKPEGKTLSNPARDRELLASALELANSGVPAVSDTARAYLAQRRRTARRAQAAAPPARTTCGAQNDLGQCVERYHDLGCAGLPDNTVNAATFAAPGAEADAAWKRAADQRARMTDITRGAYTDMHGRQFSDQNGDAVTLAGVIDENAGHVLRRGYAPERPEMPVAQRRKVTHTWGDNEERGVDIEYNPMVATLKESIDPSPERPADLAIRRSLAGVRTGTLGRHWADSYDKTDLEALGR